MIGPVGWRNLWPTRWLRSLLNPSRSSVHHRLQFLRHLPSADPVTGLSWPGRRGKGSRASSSVVGGVDDGDVAAVIRKRIKTNCRERLGADYSEADFKTKMRRYVGRELQFGLKICHVDKRPPADHMRFVRYAREYAETSASPKSVGGSISTAATAASPPPVAASSSASASPPSYQVRDWQGDGDDAPKKQARMGSASKLTGLPPGTPLPKGTI
eukprot:4567233-Pyramimonas_sp.AAC.2